MHIMQLQKSAEYHVSAFRYEIYIMKQMYIFFKFSVAFFYFKLISMKGYYRIS